MTRSASASPRAKAGTARSGRATVTRPELLENGSDRAFRSLVHDTLAFSARIQDVRARFAALIGLTGAQYTILTSIAHLEGEDGIGINAVAEHLHLSGAFVTIEVNKLSAAGLVTKRSDPKDGRRVQLRITAEASRRLEGLKPVQAPVNDALFASLTRAEFKALRALMERLVTHGDEALALLAYYESRTGTGSKA